LPWLAQEGGAALLWRCWELLLQLHALALGAGFACEAHELGRQKLQQAGWRRLLPSSWRGNTSAARVASPSAWPGLGLRLKPALSLAQRPASCLAQALPLRLACLCALPLAPRLLLWPRGPRPGRHKRLPERAPPQPWLAPELGRARGRLGALQACSCLGACSGAASGRKLRLLRPLAARAGGRSGARAEASAAPWPEELASAVP